MADNPQINPILGNGCAYYQAKRIEKYIDEVLHCAAKSFPPGLKYHGYRQATPEEQFHEITRYYRKKRVYELAPSDLYHCVYDFSFNGEKLKPQYMQLPYIRPGGIIRIRGATYTTSPVLEDNIFSVSSDHIYMPVTRGKLIFKKLDVGYRVGHTVVSVPVIHSMIYNLNKKARCTNRVSTLIHYILGEYGLEEAFMRYYNTAVAVGYEEINEQTYPPEQWVICTTLGLKPSIRGYTNYIPSSIRLAVPRDRMTPGLAGAIGGFFYIVDREPRAIDVGELNNRMFWRRLLARFIKENNESETKAIEEMDAHYDSLYSYIDDLVRLKLEKEGVFVTNLFDLLAYLMDTYVEKTMRLDPADMLDKKRVDATRAMLSDIVYNISTLTFDLRKMSGDRLNYSNISGVFSKKFPTNKIKQINRGHGEVNTLVSATDNFLYATTKLLVPQTKATFTRKKSKDADMVDPAHALHYTQCLVSSYLFITKSDPSARSSINHLMDVDEHGNIMVEGDLLSMVKQLDRYLSISEGENRRV